MLSTRSIALCLTLAAVGLAPAAAVAKNGADDPASHAGDDKGAAVQPGDDKGAAVEPGDDKGAAVEPGDDKGAAVQPGDDKGAAVEPGDDKGAAVELGDDKGARRSDTSRAKRVSGSCTGRSSAKLKVKRSNG